MNKETIGGTGGILILGNRYCFEETHCSSSYDSS